MAPRRPEASRAGKLRLIVRRTIKASAERLFQAWTEPEQLVKWWGPPPARCPHAEIDLREGGQYRIANVFPDGSTIWICGEFERISPPRILVFTWRLEGSEDKDERVSVRFQGRGKTTDIIVTHERISTAEAKQRHEQGWNGCLDGLEMYASSSS